MESLKKSWGPDCRVCSARPAARPCPRQPLCPCCPDLPGTPRMLLHSRHLLQGWSCSSVTVSHADEPSCTLPPPRPTQPTATHLQPFPPAPGCSVLPNVGKGPPSALHTQHRAADALCVSHGQGNADSQTFSETKDWVENRESVASPRKETSAGHPAPTPPCPESRVSNQRDVLQSGRCSLPISLIFPPIKNILGAHTPGAPRSLLRRAVGTTPFSGACFTRSS